MQSQESMKRQLDVPLTYEDLRNVTGANGTTYYVVEKAIDFSFAAQTAYAFELVVNGIKSEDDTFPTFKVALKEDNHPLPFDWKTIIAPVVGIMCLMANTSLNHVAWIPL